MKNELLNIRGIMGLLSCGHTRAKRIVATLEPDKDGRYAKAAVVDAARLDAEANKRPNADLREQALSKKIELLVEQIANARLERERREFELEKARTAPTEAVFPASLIREQLRLYLSRLHMKIREATMVWAPSLAGLELPKLHAEIERMTSTCIHAAHSDVRSTLTDPATSGLWPDYMSRDPVPMPTWKE